MSQSTGVGTASDAGELQQNRRLQVERVADELASKNIKIRSKFDDLPFFRSTAVRSVWQDRECLHQVLFELTPDRAEHVWRDALLFITFLVYIEVPLDFYSKLADRLFSDNNGSNLAYQDSDLPYPETRLLQLGLNPARASKWDSQYLFTPATIIFNSQVEEVQKLESKAVRLPFLDCERSETHHGGYGEVRFFQIAHEYVKKWDSSSSQMLSMSQAPIVAVKSFRAREYGLDEARNLQILKKALTSNSSISLHEVIIEQGQGHSSEFFIIFPHAGLGDLFQFLHEGSYLNSQGRLDTLYRFEDYFPSIEAPNTGKPRDHLACVLLEQCKSIAGALRFLHGGIWSGAEKVFCAHMDLKPSNIIIFRGGEVGTWKICDFGISVFKDKDDASTTWASVGDLISQLTLRTRARRQSGPYQAPEIHDEDLSGHSYLSSAQVERRVGRSSDIWSFGGILGEVLAFALGGKSGVEEFQQTRRQIIRGVRVDYFYSPAPDPSHQKYVVGAEVLAWLDRCSPQHESFPSWVSCWALCVKGILQVDPSRRPNAEELEELVSHIERHVSNLSTEAECGTSHGWYEGGRRFNRKPGPLSPVPEGRDVGVSAPWFAQHQRHDVTTAIIPADNPSLSVSTATDSRHGSASGTSHSDSPFTGQTRISAEGRSSTTGQVVEVFDSVSVRGSVSGHNSSHHDSEVSVKGNQGLSGVAPHGIMCNPDQPRHAHESQVHDLDIGSGKPIAVAADNRHVAYLNGDTVRVFRLSPPSFGSDWTLNRVVKLDMESARKGPTWTGIGVGWPFLAVWGHTTLGRTQERESQLHISKWDEEASRFFRVPHAEDQDLSKFDYEKRVAVSTLGFVVVNRYRKLIVISTSPPYHNINITAPKAEDPWRRPLKDVEFLDLAVNEPGNLLFAWASVGTWSALLIYRLELSNRAKRLEPISIGFYNYQTSEEEHLTRIFPYNTAIGCVVAASGNLFFPAVIRDNSSTSGPDIHPREICKDLRKCEPRAVSMHGNHSLIVVLKSSKGLFRSENRLVEYALRVENGSWKFDQGKELSVLKEKTASTSVIRTAVVSGAVLILICHLSGKVEIVRFLPRETG